MFHSRWGAFKVWNFSAFGCSQFHMSQNENIKSSAISNLVSFDVISMLFFSKIKFYLVLLNSSLFICATLPMLNVNSSVPCTSLTMELDTNIVQTRWIHTIEKKNFSQSNNLYSLWIRLCSLLFLPFVFTSSTFVFVVLNHPERMEMDSWVAEIQNCFCVNQNVFHFFSCTFSPRSVRVTSLIFFPRS